MPERLVSWLPRWKLFGFYTLLVTWLEQAACWRSLRLRSGENSSARCMKDYQKISSSGACENTFSQPPYCLDLLSKFYQ